MGILSCDVFVSADTQPHTKTRNSGSRAVLTPSTTTHSASTSNPSRRFYTKRTPPCTYLRVGRAKFLRGETLRARNIASDGSARNLPPRTRTHAHTFSSRSASPESKQNRTLSINSNSRKGKPPRRRFLASLFLARLCSKSFRRALHARNATRHGSAIRCQNKKSDARDREREKVSPTTRHGSSFSNFPGAERGRAKRGGDEETKGDRRRGNLSILEVAMKHRETRLPLLAAV